MRWPVTGAPSCADLLTYVYELRLQEKEPPDMGPEGYGRGIFISDDGKFLTSLHIFEQWPRSKRGFIPIHDGGSYVEHPVETVIGASRRLDMAVVKIRLSNAKVKIPPIGAVVRVGEPVSGFRSGVFETLCTSGQILAVSANKILIQGNHFLLPGSSGAPIFNHAGQVVAVAIEMIPLNPGANPRDLKYEYAGVPIGKALAIPKLSSPLSLKDFLATQLQRGINQVMSDGDVIRTMQE